MSPPELVTAIGGILMVSSLGFLLFSFMAALFLVHEWVIRITAGLAMLAASVGTIVAIFGTSWMLYTKVVTQ